ncbi:WG repeat-containing protein [Pedobacter sp. PAMC26386]|nr:WG repeat-containing protein [Pedobacter sp. PAMC26386]
MKFIYSVIIAMLLSNTGIAQEKTSNAQYPWLAKSGKFGYCNLEGKVLIQPEFDGGDPFKNGYAVVCKNGLYGVINEVGKVIVPLKYPSLQIYAKGVFTLAIYKTESNARAQFWKWKLMPEFNVLSTSNKGPFLSTSVPRATWTIKSLPDDQVIFKETREEEDKDRTQYWRKDWEPSRGIPSYIHLSSLGNTLKVGDNLFVRNADHQLKKVAGNVLELIDDTSILAFNKEQYFKLNIKGEKQNKENFTMVDSILLHVNPDKIITVLKQNPGMYPFPTIADFIFKNNEGKTYLFPDLNKPFPTQIQDYKRGTELVPAAEILAHAVLISSVPDSKYFLVLAVFGKINERRMLLLDGDGNWNTEIPAYEGLDQMLGSGEMLLTRSVKKGILTRNLEFKTFPFDYRAHHTDFSKNMFSGKDAVSKKYGIYDFSKEKWLVAPVYSYLGNEVVPGIIIYTLAKEDNSTRKEWYGLLDMESNQQITPPVYDTIDYNSRVTKTENGTQISYYINPRTGQEYRE